jgi:hypothetical protein
MYFPYADFVSVSEVEVMSGCFYMWWDNLCSVFWVNVSARMREEGALEELPTASFKDLNQEETQILDTMFETLVQTLNLGEIRCQQAALHGLGHLHHPKVPEIVQHYMDHRAQNWPPEGIQWLRECRDGTVM